MLDGTRTGKKPSINDAASVLLITSGNRSGNASALTWSGMAPPYLLHVQRFSSLRNMDVLLPALSRCLDVRRHKSSRPRSPRPRSPIAAIKLGMGDLNLKVARSVADAAKKSASSGAQSKSSWLPKTSEALCAWPSRPRQGKPSVAAISMPIASSTYGSSSAARAEPGAGRSPKLSGTPLCRAVAPPLTVSMKPRALHPAAFETTTNIVRSQAKKSKPQSQKKKALSLPLSHSRANSGAVLPCGSAKDRCHFDITLNSELMLRAAVSGSTFSL
mmetsp:Transcript_27025/g.86748  ORF Transcript_27025/g.86748 Transcript_27025/m.86748 type:complete len:273 (+) Transcript_27025:1445-2263(+)